MKKINLKSILKKTFKNKTTKKRNKVKLKNRHFKDSREQKISKMPNIPALVPIDVSSLYAGRAPETLSMATRATFDWMIKELHTSMPGAAAALVNRMEAHAKGIRAQQTSLAQRQLRQLNRNNSSNNSSYNGSNSIYFPTFHPEVAEKDFFDAKSGKGLPEACSINDPFLFLQNFFFLTQAKGLE